jgi:hypothetical protein
MEWLLKIDRRVIFCLIALAVALPLLRPMGLPIHVTPYAQSLYDAVDEIPPNGPPLLLSMDFSPQVLPELYPMAIAILRHCFARNISVIGMSLYPEGAGLGELAITQVAEEYGKKSGIDYTFLGYKPGYFVVILNMGENLREQFPTDYYGVPLDSLPMMDGIRSFGDIPLAIELAGSAILTTWITYAGAQYHQTLGAGCTAVMSADYFPFLQTGQLIGLLNGMKGASEYEYLVARNGLSKGSRPALRGMDAVSVAHLVIMAFVIIGNIGYFSQRRRSRGEAAETQRRV